MNVLLTTFPGLGLPSTVCIPVSLDLNTLDLYSLIGNLLPSPIWQDIYLTTTDNRRFHPSSITTLAQLVDAACLPQFSTTFLPLRLTAPLLGGKGGFGSQLRAAGGRMSSRKKRQNAELATGSARNLDGRRLRTIKEAKNLATYLAAKPEMDRRQKEEQRKRWEQVIELAEQREADMRAGKGVDGRRKGLSEEWLEEKEDVADGVKNAVKLAMSADLESEKGKETNHSGSDHSAADSAEDNSEDEDPMELDQHDMARLTREAEIGDVDALWVLKNKLKIPESMLPKQKVPRRRFAGFEDDDDDDDEDDDFSSDTEDDVSGEALSKGKEVLRDT